ncbi:MAG: hypothetical protein ACLS3M_03590 [Collinsella sp.]
MRDHSQELLSLVDDGDEQIKKRAKRLARRSANCSSPPRRSSVRAIRCSAFFVTRWVVEWRAQMGGAELVWESRDLPRAEWTLAGPSSYELLYRSGAI